MNRQAGCVRRERARDLRYRLLFEAGAEGMLLVVGGASSTEAHAGLIRAYSRRSEQGLAL